MPLHKPLHPGRLVKEVLIDGTGLSITEAADRLEIHRATLSRLINGHYNLTPDIAFRLSQFFQNSIEMWLNLQLQYDVWLVTTRKKPRIKIKPLRRAA
jgi:addiction module HigA family antidote